MKWLLAFRGLTHDPQRVLTAVYRLAFVGIELVANAYQCSIWVCQSLAHYAELSIAALTDAERWGLSGIFYDPQFALRHDCSLAHLAGRQ